MALGGAQVDRRLHEAQQVGEVGLDGLQRAREAAGDERGVLLVVGNLRVLAEGLEQPRQPEDEVVERDHLQGMVGRG